MSRNESRYVGMYYVGTRPMKETVTTKLDCDIDDIKARLTKAEEVLQAQDNWIKQMAKATPFMMWKRDDTPKPEPKYPCLTCKHGHRFIGSPCSFIRCSLNSSKLTQDATHCCDYAEKQ